MLLFVRRVKERLGAIVPQGAAATAGGALFCGGISEWGGFLVDWQWHRCRDNVDETP